MQMQIAINLARIYMQVLQEPVPIELARLLAGLGATGRQRLDAGRLE